MHREQRPATHPSPRILGVIACNQSFFHGDDHSETSAAQQSNWCATVHTTAASIDQPELARPEKLAEHSWRLCDMSSSPHIRVDKTTRSYFAACARPVLLEPDPI